MTSSPDREAAEATKLALAHLTTLGKAPEKYRLVLLQNALQGADASPTRWRVGFKLRELLPARAGEEIGKGGDFYLDVDLETSQVSLAKGGH